jgi:hypothetical protein
MENRKFGEMKRDREVFKQLREKMTQIEKMWLLDCAGDYRLYIARLYKLAIDHKIEIPKAK